MLRRAWPRDAIYWKQCCGGSCQDLLFITTLDRVSQSMRLVERAAASCNYPQDNLGFYIQPLEQGRVCHLGCNIYYDPSDVGEVVQARVLHEMAAELLLERGALFTRPYGHIAELVYGRATDYTNTLRKVKGLLDPNNILSPGRLCF